MQHPRQIQLNATPVRSRRTFSLTELVVVIAVLAILLAMLQPALKRSIRMTRDVGCRNHLRVVGLTAFQYADDWQGILPTAGGPNSYQYGHLSDTSWPSKLNLGANGTGDLACPAGEEALPTLPNWFENSGHYTLNRYLGGEYKPMYPSYPTLQQLTSETFWFTDGTIYLGASTSFISSNMMPEGIYDATSIIKTTIPWPWLMQTPAAPYVLGKGHGPEGYSASFVYGDLHVDAFDRLGLKERYEDKATAMKVFCGQPQP